MDQNSFSNKTANVTGWKQSIPILDWLPKYRSPDFRGDFIAGITVGIMLIPQGMAYAMLAGLPPLYGLYASITPLILYAIFGTSRQLAVGPVAMVSLLVATGVGAIAGSDLEYFIGLSILLSFIVGVLLILMGILRLGFLVNFLSHPVISGFTSAAALIIGISQLKHLLGIDLPRSHFIHEVIISAAREIAQVNLATLGIGLVAILLIILVRRFKVPIPGPLLAVVFGIAIVKIAHLDAAGVQIVGEIPKGLPGFSVPTINWADIKSLIPIALTITLVGFMESIAVAKSIQAKRKNYRIIPNQELIALGMANLGGSFFQSFPTTGGFSRTAVNNQAGANTGLASIISAALIALTLLFFTPVFYHLPKAILAAVIMVAVFGLIDFKEARHLWKTDRGDFYMLLVTFIATLMIGIEGGIVMGVVLSLILIIYRTTDPHSAELAKIPGKEIYRNIDRFSELEERDDVLIFRFDARLYFANANAFREALENKVYARGTPPLEAIVLDAESINSIDSSGIRVLKELLLDFRKEGLQFFICSVKGPVRDALRRSGLVDIIGKENLFFSIHDAIDFYDHKLRDESYDKYIIQTNAKQIPN